MNPDMMHPDDYIQTMPGEDMALIGGILAVVLVIYLLVFAFMIVVYVLQSRGMHVIAKRRGIHHPWLAWLPVGNMWIMGSISDQYQYVVKGRVRNRRKVLLGLTIAMYALMIPVWIAYYAMLFEAIMSEGDVAYSMVGYGAVILLFALTMAVVAIVAAVFEYIALYDLFVSCDPNNSVMYLVLSIFINVTLPFFIFACRNKDLGMPPRKPAIPAQPQWQQAPVQPQWQPVSQTPAQPEELTETPAPAEESVPAAEETVLEEASEEE